MKRLLLTCLLLVVVSALLSVSLSGVFAQIPVPIPQLATPIMVVNTPMLNARSGPGPQFTVLATLPGGIELPVLGSTPDQEWYLVTTPLGNAWIDVDFVLARGDFSFVPVINPVAPAPPQVILPTALTLQMPTSRLFGTQSPIAVAGTSTRRAALQVLSVDLRRGAFEESGVITTLYLDPNIDFVVLGTQFDRRGVEWVAIQVPGIGTGWIERAKTRIYDRLITPTEALHQQPANVTAPNTLLPFPIQTLATPIAIVNTPFVNVRTGPGGQFSVLWVSSGGTTFDVVGVTPDVVWVLVEGEPFGVGWVNAPFVLLRGDLSTVPVINY
jgi:uncharacterized protein YgiM (DUF1202 family)